MELISLAFGLLCTPVIGLVYCFIAGFFLYNQGAFARFIQAVSLTAIPLLLCEFVLLNTLGAKEADARFDWFYILIISNFLFGPPCLANLASRLFATLNERMDERSDSSREINLAKRSWQNVLPGTIVFTIAAWVLTFALYGVSDAVNGIDGMGDAGG